MNFPKVQFVIYRTQQQVARTSLIKTARPNDKWHVRRSSEVSRATATALADLLYSANSQPLDRQKKQPVH
jgi:hypothetical protein